MSTETGKPVKILFKINSVIDFFHRFRQFRRSKNVIKFKDIQNDGNLVNKDVIIKHNRL